MNQLGQISNLSPRYPGNAKNFSFTAYEPFFSGYGKVPMSLLSYKTVTGHARTEMMHGLEAPPLYFLHARLILTILCSGLTMRWIAPP